MIVEIVLATLALAAAGSTVYAVRRKWLASNDTPALPAARQLGKGELVPDDVVAHLGVDYLVEGVATLTEGDQPVIVLAWLHDGDQGKVLLLDLEERPRCVLTQAEESEQIVGSLPSWIRGGGVELRLARRAAVRARCQGSCFEGLPERGACEFGIYRGPGQREAIALLTDRGDLLLAGRAVTEAGLTLLPGGSARG